MGWEWDDTPQWRKEGRTGPGPLAPRYASRKDRRDVRMGREVGGGRRKIPHNIPQGKTSHRKSKGCCSMVAAVRSAKDGNWRLARRYVRLTPRFVASHFA